MHFEPGAGSVLYRSRMNKKQGGNFAALSPTDFIAAVTQHIPDKGFQLVRYYAWYSNKARGVRAKTGAAQAEDCAHGHEPDRAPASAQWRRLIAKIWEADLLTCPDCGAEMKMLSFIKEGRVIGKDSPASGPTARSLARSAAPGARLRAIYNDLPSWKRRTSSTSRSERPKSLRRRPFLFLAPGPATRKPKTRPNQREKPKTALTAARGFCKLQRAGRKSVSAPKPNLEGGVLLLDPKTKFLSLA